MMNIDRIKQIVSRFRQHALSRHAEDIDPLSQEERQKRIERIQDDDMREIFEDLFAPEPIDNIAGLLLSPRLLKHVLRRVDDAWERLHGEVDFDELLVVHTLQYAAERAYAFLVLHIDDIRSLKRSYSDEKAAEKYKRLRAEWDNSVSEDERESADALVAFLFPLWKTLDGAPADKIPQGVAHSAPTDYWRRIQSESISKDEIRDQDVLSRLKTWLSGERDISDVLYDDPTSASKVEQLGASLTGEHVRRMAGELFSTILSRNGSKANERACLAFASLYRMTLARPWDQHKEWLLGEMKKALPVSINFTNQLYYYFRNTSYEDTKLSVAHPDLCEAVVAASRELWSVDIKNMIKATSPELPYTLWHYAVFFSDPNAPKDKLLDSEWTWFAECVVRAAGVAPDVILPQLVPFVIFEVRGYEEDRLESQWEAAQTLFGSHFEFLMRSLAENMPVEASDERETVRRTFAKMEARKWLSRRDSSPTDNRKQEGGDA